MSAARALAQPVYRAGDIIENFSLISRRTGQPMPIADFAGKILFLDFFAHWCPVCNAAAPQLESGIYERYREAGNAAGLPVVYVLCNLQGDFTPRDMAGTDAFTGRFGPDVFVLQDNDRALQRRFTSASGQPTFAVINGVANSASHRQWELVYSLHGYRSPGGVQPIGEFQTAIDSVQAPPALTPVSLTSQPQSQTVSVGESASFNVTGTGTPPLNYQWQFNGSDIADATSATLMLDNIQVAQAGEYSVVVSNEAGSVASQVAKLTVVSPPAGPATLRGFRKLADGPVEFSVGGEAGRAYRIETSSDLVNWVAFTTVTVTDGNQTVRETGLANIASRFIEPLRSKFDRNLQEIDFQP